MHSKSGACAPVAKVASVKGHKRGDPTVRQIIDGKAYDTSTATQLGEAYARAARSDFGWWHETLYRTPKGRYFLAGEGGPASSWARPAIGGGRIGGEGIRAMSESEAQGWAERYLTAAEYEAIWTPEEA